MNVFEWKLACLCRKRRRIFWDQSELLIFTLTLAITRNVAILVIWKWGVITLKPTPKREIKKYPCRFFICCSPLFSRQNEPISIACGPQEHITQVIQKELLMENAYFYYNLLNSVWWSRDTRNLMWPLNSSYPKTSRNAKLAEIRNKKFCLSMKGPPFAEKSTNLSRVPPWYTKYFFVGFW